MQPRVRLAGPLPCAIALAVALAVTGLGRPAVTLPAGTIADDRDDDRIVGTVGGPVLITPRGHGAPVTLDGPGATKVWVWTAPPIAALEPGQVVAVTGRLRRPRGSLSPGSPDRAAIVASRGAAWELTATRIEILADEPGPTARAWRWAAATQRELVARMGSETDDNAPARAALQGIVTGDRTRIPPELDARWRAVGIYHVLSVSGLHLAVIAGLMFALLRRLVAASPLGGRTRPARWAAPIAFALAIAYTLVTGAQLATLRALLVVGVILGGQMLDRPVRLVDALGAAAIAILVWRPQDLYDASFQLSFVAALTLALLPPQPPAPDVRWRVRVARWFVRGLATSAWVTITTAPITALHFQQVAAGGVLGNLILTPIVELAALPLGLAGAVLDLGPLIELAVWLVAQVDAVAGVLAHAMPVGVIALGSPLLAAPLVGLALWSCSRRRRTRVELVAWLVMCTAWVVAPASPPRGSLRVTFLDVGQGDAAIVELPGGSVWLVDAGGVANARDSVAASAPGQTIARTLGVYGHAAIDLAIVSHPHPDHYLGLAGLSVPVRELWATRDDDPRNTDAGFRRLTDALAARGTQVRTPALGALAMPDGVTLHVWAPRYAAADGVAERLAPDPVRSVNDNSLVIAIEYAGRTIMFAGDLEAEGEEALVAAGLPAVDVVKVAHHGSRTSSSATFVAATRPGLAVISCGVANAFGFPAAEVVGRWHAVGATVARTDLDGAITVHVDAEGDLTVERYTGPGP